MSTATQAIKFRRKGGDLREAVQVVLGKKEVSEDASTVSEGEASKQQTQVWLAPDHDKANRAMLNMKKFLPGVDCTIGPNNKPAGGFLLTCTGTYMPNAIASLLSGMGGVFRVDNSSGIDLGR